MALDIAYSFFAVFLLIAIIGFYVFTKYYSDPHETEKLPTFVVVASLIITFLCLLIVPVDVYSISVATGSDPAQDATNIRGTYYASYITLVVVGFVIIPFAYFWYEENDPENTFQKRLWAATKYTIFTVLIALLFLILGLTLRFRGADASTSTHQWVNDILGKQDRGDHVIQFMISCLGLLGVTAWILYGGYGLAAIPIGLIKGRVQYSAEKETLEQEQDAIRERIRSMSSKYQLTGRQMTRADKKEMTRLQRQEKLLGSRSDRLQKAETTFWTKAADCFRPFSLAFGILLLLCSVFLVVSLFLTTLDRTLHSSCGISCGFAVSGESQIVNPFDKMMVALSKVFPMDYIFLSLVLLLLFCASLHGLSKIGVRCFCVQMYRLRRGGTPPQGLLLASLVLMFTVVVISLELISFAPQYITFGSQTYTEPNNAVVGTVITRPCTLDANSTLCQQSQISVISRSVSLSTEFFSLIFFFANWGFIGAFVICAIVLAVKKQTIEDDADDSDVSDDEETEKSRLVSA